MPTPHVDWTINVSNLLAIIGVLWYGARMVIRSVKDIVERVDIHERALIRSGWLHRTRDGSVEVTDYHSPV